MDQVRVLRVIEYVGPREWVEKTVGNSVHGTKIIGPGCISAATLGTYPEVLQNTLAEPKTDNHQTP